MCNMCYGFIYDTILYPYHVGHSLRNAVSLSDEETHRITQTFLDVISDFRDLYFFEDFDTELTPDQCDIWTWTQFKMENPEGNIKLETEVKKIIESMKEKKCSTENLVTRFFMNKFKILMVNLPQIHLDHTFKICPKENSPGPVPYEKLVEIRKKAGLPIPEYKENFEDLYS